MFNILQPKFEVLRLKDVIFKIHDKQKCCDYRKSSCSYKKKKMQIVNFMLKKERNINVYFFISSTLRCDENVCNFQTKMLNF